MATRLKLKEESLKHERLLELLEYTPETGIFVWKKTFSNAKQGQEAGWVVWNKYKKIAIDSKEYMAHRLAWFYINKEWPKEDLDHIDGNRQNNTISNLREASRSQNLQNKRKQSNNSSGFIGVSYNKKLNKWDARLCVFGKQICLGLFRTAEEASKAYEDASSKYFGEYKRKECFDVSQM